MKGKEQAKDGDEKGQAQRLKISPTVGRGGTRQAIS